MITQEIFETFIHQGCPGEFYVIDPLNADGVVGYGYTNEEDARKAFLDFVEKENIVFE